jgi:hypothetical protein
MNPVESATSAKRTLARLADVLGNVPAPVQPESFQDYLRRLSLNAPPDVSDGVGTIAGAAAGAYGWKGHRWLGAIGGASLGRNLPALLLKPTERGMAFSNMGVTASAIFGSLSLPGSPKLGFILGWLIGGMATGFVKK